MKTSKIALVIALALAVAIAGCTSSSAGAPSVSILEPKNGAIIPGSTVTVKIGISGVKLAAPDGTTVVQGEGHVHVYLDSANEQRGGKTIFTFQNVASGEHTIKAELHRGDHSAFSPAVELEVKVNVRGGAAPSAPPAPPTITQKAGQKSIPPPPAPPPLPPLK